MWADVGVVPDMWHVGVETQAAMELAILHVSLKEHAHICMRPFAEHAGGAHHLNGVTFICRRRPISPGTRGWAASSRGLDLHLDVAGITGNMPAGCIVSAAWPSHRWRQASP
jgi:hypothetical protein